MSQPTGSADGGALDPPGARLVSVCIPTYRRPDLLVRAVKSALSQTHRNVEVVVSDDATDGAAQQALERAFGAESRLRFVKNLGEKGQVGNTNNALLHARGEWIKLLHDDDVLKPQCVERLLAVAGIRDAVLVTCRADRFHNGRLVDEYERANGPWLEMIPAERSAISAYLLFDLGGSLPSQQFVRRSIIETGILFELVGKMHVLVDSCWRVRVLSHGAGLIVNEALVEWHQGNHETVTSGASLDSLDEEFVELRSYLLRHIPDTTGLPNLSVVEGFVRLVRAVARAKRGHVRPAARHIAKVHNPQSYLMVLRHLLGRKAILGIPGKVALTGDGTHDEPTITANVDAMARGA